ncbi:hypothetical protein FRB99_008653, partial [Tulasnella sp. 403]
MPLGSVPDPAYIAQLIANMRDTVLTLTQTFDSLHDQNARVASITGIDPVQQVKAMQKELVELDRKQEEHIIELKVMLREVLVQKIASQLRERLREFVKEQIAPVIKKRVAEELKAQFPPGLREQVQAHNDQLHLVRINLHNAEARRANRLIKANQLHEPLTPILKDDGEPSLYQPPHLSGLFAMS